MLVATLNASDSPLAESDLADMEDVYIVTNKNAEKRYEAHLENYESVYFL